MTPLLTSSLKSWLMSLSPLGLQLLVSNCLPLKRSFNASTTNALMPHTLNDWRHIIKTSNSDVSPALQGKSIFLLRIFWLEQTFILVNEYVGSEREG